jgi:hypothetical protein
MLVAKGGIMNYLLTFMIFLAVGLALFPVKPRSKKERLREIDSTKAPDLLRPAKREKVTA